MILSICAPGHTAEAVRDAATSLAEPLRSASVADPDLFSHALDCKTIVYAPLDAPGGDTEKMRAVLKAAHAPGVKRVVVIFQEGDAPREDALLLQRDGVGYTILRSRAAIDGLPVASRTALASAIRDAITRDDLCGATIDVAIVDMAQTTRRAANVAGANDSGCPECGGVLERHRRPVLVDPRGVVFPRPVAAVACRDCGRTFAAPQVWSRRDAEGARQVRRSGNLAA